MWFTDVLIYLSFLLIRMRDLEVEDQLYEVEHQLQELAVSGMFS